MGKLYGTQFRFTSNAETNKNLVRDFFALIPEITIKYEGVDAGKHYLIIEKRFSAAIKDVIYLVLVFSGGYINMQVYPDIHPTAPWSPFMNSLSSGAFSSTPGQHFNWVDYGYTSYSYGVDVNNDAPIKFFASDELLHFNLGNGNLMWTVFRPNNLPPEADRNELSYLPHVTNGIDLGVLTGIKQRIIDGNNSALSYYNGSGLNTYQQVWLMYPGNPTVMIPNSADGGKRMAKFGLELYSAAGKLGDLSSNIMVGAASGMKPYVDRLIIEDGSSYVLIPGVKNVPHLFARVD